MHCENKVLLEVSIQEYVLTEEDIEILRQIHEETLADLDKEMATLRDQEATL